ncbi:hypothetical protein GCM10009854_35190 [Saccharopolyspora halophila]|uniref:Uncharacterized protein n=1 Tax=Saccharopolyspora halophila TaxID=405551 RepID=A0ABP5TJQ9_9PSEU
MVGYGIAIPVGAVDVRLLALAAQLMMGQRPQQLPEQPLWTASARWSRWPVLARWCGYRPGRRAAALRVGGRSLLVADHITATAARHPNDAPEQPAAAQPPPG